MKYAPAEYGPARADVAALADLIQRDPRAALVCVPGAVTVAEAVECGAGTIIVTMRARSQTERDDAELSRLVREAIERPGTGAAVVMYLLDGTRAVLSVGAT